MGGCIAIGRHYFEHALESSPMRFCTVQYACLSSQANPPSRLENCSGLNADPKARHSYMKRDTYGAETDLRNKLSSNNQIIHVSESNNGGTRADMSGTFP